MNILARRGGGAARRPGGVPGGDPDRRGVRRRDQHRRRRPGLELRRQRRRVRPSDRGHRRDWFNAEIDIDKEIDKLTAEDGPLREFAANNAGDVAASVLGGVFQAFTVALFTFYLVADGPRLRRTICSTLRPERHREVLRAWELAIDRTGGYIYSRTLLAGLSAAATWIALTIIGVPYALPLALWVGVISQFVPVVGAYRGGDAGGHRRARRSRLRDLDAGLHRGLPAARELPTCAAHHRPHDGPPSGRCVRRVVAGQPSSGRRARCSRSRFAAVAQAFVSTYIRRHTVVESDLTQDSRRRAFARRHRPLVAGQPNFRRPVDPARDLSRNYVHRGWCREHVHVHGHRVVAGPSSSSSVAVRPLRPRSLVITKGPSREPALARPRLIT